MKLFKTFETLMAAAAFAEENEHATASEIAGEALTTEPTSRESRAPLAGTLAVEHGK